MDVCETIRFMLDDPELTSPALADALLAHAVKLDDGRPGDDISVVVIRVTERQGDSVRRMQVRLPIEASRPG
jgi:hypothetical protein